MNVLQGLKEKCQKRPVHLTLIDPEKQNSSAARDIAGAAREGGTDGIMIGGSAGVSQVELDATIQEIKKSVDLPVILFPGDISGVSPYADAIFFMSLLNSRNPYYITGAQAMGAIAVKKAGIETIPMGYLIIEPGGTVGFVGDAKLIPRKKVDIAAAYSLAAQYMGMKAVYLEAGSGADRHVDEAMIAGVKSLTDILLIVGGGIRTEEDASRVSRAGADIIVTGTVVEQVEDVKEKVRELVDATRKSRS